jgi:hypothetical protein
MEEKIKIVQVKHVQPLRYYVLHGFLYSNAMNSIGITEPISKIIPAINPLIMVDILFL